MARTAKAATEDKLKPFHFHGVDLNNDPNQAMGDCPFCDSPGKLGVQSDTGKWRCLKCQLNGNVYTFLSELHQLAVSRTTVADLEGLADERELDGGILQQLGICRNPITGDWIAPGYNDSGKLSNLYKGVSYETEAGSKIRFMSTPGCKLAPFHSSLLLGDGESDFEGETVYVVEGLWDAACLLAALRGHRYDGGKFISTANPDNSLGKQFGVFPVPGAGNFNPDWFKQLAGKNLIIAYDNDHPKRYGPEHPDAGQLMVNKATGEHIRPGWDGMRRVYELAKQSNVELGTISLVNWAAYDDGKAIKSHPTPGHHPKLKNGYDLRDLLTDSPARGLRLLASMVETQAVLPPKKSNAAKGGKTAAPLFPPIHRESFDDLVADFSASLHFTPALRDTLAVMLAVVISTDLSADVDHTWLRVIGPPGSGKSTLAEAVSAAREWVAPKSTLTGFHSGFVDYDKVTGERIEDASLLHELNNKTVIMKDADTLVNSPNRDKILSELRDLYDGQSRSHYRNKVKSDFENIKLTFILCGTDALRLLNKTFLGERFLDIEILRSNEDTTPYLNRASASAYASLTAGMMANVAPAPGHEGADEETSTSTKQHLKQCTYGFVKHLKDTLHGRQPPTMEQSTLRTLEGLGKYVSMLRARKPDSTDINYRARTELPTRLTNQFVKMAFSLALVLNRPTVDDEVLRVVRKVVADTSLGFQQEIVEALYKEKQATMRALALSLNLAETTIRRLLLEMLEFKVVQRCSHPNNSGQRGRDSHMWELSPLMQDLYVIAYPPQPKTANTKTAKTTGKHSSRQKPGPKRPRK